MGQEGIWRRRKRVGEKERGLSRTVQRKEKFGGVSPLEKEKRRGVTP
jgi:hypothetical protein